MSGPIASTSSFAPIAAAFFICSTLMFTTSNSAWVTTTRSQPASRAASTIASRSEEHTSELQSHHDLVCRLLLEKKKLAKRAWFQTNELKAGRWTPKDNVYLRGKTLGLVGAGSIAAELARLGQAIGMEVLAWTFHPTPERAARLGVTFVSLEELLSRSDVVSLHVKLTSESRGLIGAEQIAW